MFIFNPEQNSEHFTDGHAETEQMEVRCLHIVGREQWQLDTEIPDSLKKVLYI